jgi:hypothetical protein
MQDHLEQFVNNFICSERRERLLWLISKRDDAERWSQAKFELFRFSPNRHDTRYATRLTDKQSAPSQAGKLLQDAGAPRMCYRLNLFTPDQSEEAELPLTEAVAVPFFYGGTLISSIPGALAFLHGDVKGDTFLFQKQRPNPGMQPTAEKRGG